MVLKENLLISDIMVKNIFEMGEVPYNELSYVGLSQEMVDDLPENSLDAIMKGMPSPLIKFSTKNENGKEKKWPGRFMLNRDNKGDVHVMIIPKMKTVSFETISGDNFSEDEIEALNKGLVVRSWSPEGEKYVQLDKMTNQLVMSDTEPVDFNIRNFTGSEDFRKKYGISDDNGSTEESLLKGETVVFSDGTHKATVGIDLLCPSGLRVIPGDSDAWLKKKDNDDLERYSFGNYGCWIKEAGGEMSYVPDEQYTEEMIDALKRNLSRNAARGQSVG